MNYIEEWVEAFLVSTGIAEEWAIYLRLVIFILILILFSSIAFLITKRIVIHYIYKFVEKSPVTWDDALADQKVFKHVAHVIPAIIVRIMAPVIFADFEYALPFVIKLTDSYLIVVGMMIVFAFLRVAQFSLASRPVFKDKPLESYFQLIRIILYVITGILVFSVLLEQTPVYFLSAFGAMTAVLMLVFKDTILGLVASVQMSSNEMVRIGDWVEMPKYGADGDVLEINLNTVKIQNWDKTITTVPTYAFISDSFKNWRGMQESGGRRIKRAIYLKMNSFRFLEEEDLEKFKKYRLLKDYVLQKEKEIEEHNKGVEAEFISANVRRLSNVGMFRVYVNNYLKEVEGVNKDMTIMVRQLAPTPHGLPMEIYCFTNDIRWLYYEGIVADIFDHLLTIVREFDLEVFEEPTGADFLKIEE